MNKDFIRITSIYTVSVAVVFYFIWRLLDDAFPNADINVIRALAATFSLNLPDSMLTQTPDMRILTIFTVIAVLSVSMIVINVYFGAAVTSHLIRPRVNLLLSLRGVLSTKWNSAMPYVLVRMCNFHRADLVDVRLSVVLTVEETRRVDGKEETFVCYLPMSDFTPPRILVMSRLMPWSIAVAADILLSNSLTKDYHFRPDMPITKSFSPDKKPVSVKRTIEVLIQGIDSKSYSSFVIHRKIPVDEQQGDTYTLHLHRGSFKSLPLQIAAQAELEQYAE